MGKEVLRRLPQPSPSQVAEWEADADQWWETRGQYLTPRQPASEIRAPSFKARLVKQPASFVVPKLWSPRPGIGYSHGTIPDRCLVHNRLLTWRESQAEACATCEPDRFEVEQATIRRKGKAA